MAITSVGGYSNNDLMPGFNRVTYYFDSTNKNQPGFRYVIDLYAAGTSTKIYEGRIAPRIGDGYGVVPLQAILSKQLSFTLNLTNDNTVAATGSQYAFDVKVGEEFVAAPWAYDDYDEYTVVGLFNGYTKLVQSPTTTAHTFVVGDQINISQTDGGTLKPMLQGLFTIVAIPDAYTVVIELQFSQVGAGSAMGGTIAYADNRKTITRNLLTRSGRVFNGAIATKDFPSYSSAVYKLAGASTTNRLLTSMPEQAMFITPGTDVWLNWGNALASSTTRMWFETSGGDQYYKVIGSTTEGIRQTNVGATDDGLVAFDGVLPMIKPDTLYYDVFVGNTTGGTRYTRSYRFYIDRRCQIEETQMLFLDRMGSFVPFAFQLRQKQRGTVTRDSYQQDLGGLSGGKWTYSNTDAGTVVTAVSVDEEYDLQTNWMNDEMSVYFAELVTSPVTFVRLNGEYFRCTIVDTSYDTERTKNKPMIKKRITVRLSNQNNINCG